MNATPDSELQGERSWPALLDVAPESNGIDLAAVRRYRQERVRAEMAARGIGAVILSDSVNIRYASGSRNMQVFTSGNAPSRYLVLTGTVRSCSSSPGASTSRTGSTPSTKYDRR